MTEQSQIIFDLTRDDWSYKGVYFGEMDNAEVDRQSNAPFSTPKGYVAGVMAIIWEDEKGIWHLKARIKFPSGNKQVITMDFDKEAKNGIKVNETFALQELYKMPMINKTWTANPSGTSIGIIEIIRDLDMVESSRIERTDAKN